MSSRTFTAAVLAAAAVSLVGPGVAGASDAGLKKVVKAQEAAVKPAAVAFRQADDGLATATDTSAASAAATAFRAGLHGFKTAIVPIKTTRADSKRGKSELLKALRSYDVALVDYQTLLTKVSGGASKSSLKATFVTLNKRFAAAAKDESTALKLLKVSA